MTSPTVDQNAPSLGHQLIRERAHLIRPDSFEACNAKGESCTHDTDAPSREMKTRVSTHNEVIGD